MQHVNIQMKDLVGTLIVDRHAFSDITVSLPSNNEDNSDLNSTQTSGFEVSLETNLKLHCCQIKDMDVKNSTREINHNHK